MTGKPFAHTALLFAKLPVAGQVKTRLCPPLTGEQAAQLHTRLIRHNLLQLQKSNIQRVEICYTGDISSPFWQHLKSEGWVLELQVGEDLGARMSHAIARALTYSQRVVVCGCDTVDLTVLRLNQLASSEPGYSAVIVPVEDGGYIAMALSQSEPLLFDGIDWGTETVLAETKQRFKKLGMRYRQLDTCRDIDVAADLKYLPPVWLEELMR